MVINKEFVLREIAGDYILVPVGDTALHFNGLITVNEVGAFLWEKLQKETTREQLIQNVLDEYEVEEEIVAKDVDDFLNRLSEAEIIQE
ncbi:MAG: PqqD family protein [Lachnospiraceae bacterium]|nr:PqqD family protein [Lachnospiraceae bacterium]